MFTQLRLVAFAATFALFGVACAMPTEGADDPASADESAANDVTADVVESSVEIQRGAKGTVTPGEPIIRVCVNKCSKFCKTMPSGNVVCGETCICVFD